MGLRKEVLESLGYPKIIDLYECPDGIWREQNIKINFECDSSHIIDAFEYMLKHQFKNRHHFERGGYFTTNPVNEDWVLKFRPDDKGFSNPITPETT